MKKRISCINCTHKQDFAFAYQSTKYYKCNSCGLISSYPLPSKSQIISHYKKQFHLGNYNLLNKNRKKYLVVYKQLANILKPHLGKKGAKNKKKILDVGCFTGDFLGLFDNKYVDTYGLELQKDAVIIAKKKFGNRIVQANIQSFKSKPNSYDAITMLGLIEHVTNPSLVLRKAKSLLKIGGIIMIQTPNSGSLISKIMGKFWPPVSPIEHIHIYSRDGLTYALEHMGFEILLAKPHWKRLSVDYIFNNLQTFGPEFHRILSGIYIFFPSFIKKANIPVYIGEMIIVAKKV